MTFQYDIVETWHWDPLATFHRRVVGCFIWDIPATSLGHTERRLYNATATSCCLVGEYSMTSGSLQNYYRDEVNDDANQNNDAGNYRINNNKYKTETIGSIVPLKYLSNFWRSLNLHLISCETELDLRWSKNCVISEISKTEAVGGDNPVEKNIINWSNSSNK